MKYLLSALIVLSLFSGCYKQDDNHVNLPCTGDCAVFNISVGTGTNSATPVNNAYVQLVWTNTLQELGETSRLIAKGYTNNKGEISFSFKALTNEFKSGSFTVTTKNNPDYFSGFRSFYNIRKSDTVLNTHVHMPSIAHLTLVYRNFDPKTPDDFFYVEPYFNNYTSNPIALQFVTKDVADYPNTFFFGTQKPFDSLVYKGNTAGDQYTYFQIIKTRNGAHVNAKDSIFIGKGETRTYEVDYQKN